METKINDTVASLLGDDLPGDKADTDSISSMADYTSTANTDAESGSVESASSTVSDTILQDEGELETDQSTEAEAETQTDSEQANQTQEEEVETEAEEQETETEAEAETSEADTALRAQVATMAARIQQQQAELAQLKAGEQKAPKYEKKTLVTEDSFAQILSDHESLNDWANSIVEHAMNAGYQLAMSEMPAKLQPVIVDMAAITLGNAEFFKANPDLKAKELRPTIALVAQELEAQHPEWEHEDVYANLGDAVRQRLGLKPVQQVQKVNQVAKAVPARPVIASARSSRVPVKVQPKLTETAKVVQSILED